MACNRSKVQLPLMSPISGNVPKYALKETTALTANTSGLCSLSCDVDSIQGHIVCYIIYLGGEGGLACNVPLKSYPGLPGPWWET